MVSTPSTCQHQRCPVAFDLDAAKGLSAQEVRTRWPRFYGVCFDCLSMVMLYASFEHFVAGDW